MAKETPRQTPNVPSPTGSADESKIVRANINRELIVSPTFVSLYANDVQVQTSPWDIRLVLGEIHNFPTVENPNVMVRQIGEVRISPQLTKKLVTILAQQLQVYETTFGTIPVPAD
jgi:hypothetical protein